MSKAVKTLDIAVENVATSKAYTYMNRSTAKVDGAWYCWIGRAKLPVKIVKTEEIAVEWLTEEMKERVR